MAAAIKALNTKIRSNPVTNYLFSTRMSTHAHVGRCTGAFFLALELTVPARPFFTFALELSFLIRSFTTPWANKALYSTDFIAPVSNFGIPVAAILDHAERSRAVSCDQKSRKAVPGRRYTTRVIPSRLHPWRSYPSFRSPYLQSDRVSRLTHCSSVSPARSQPPLQSIREPSCAMP